MNPSEFHKSRLPVYLITDSKHWLCCWSLLNNLNTTAIITVSWVSLPTDIQIITWYQLKSAVDSGCWQETCLALLPYLACLFALSLSNNVRVLTTDGPDKFWCLFLLAQRKTFHAMRELVAITAYLGEVAVIPAVAGRAVLCQNFSHELFHWLPDRFHLRQKMCREEKNTGLLNWPQVVTTGRPPSPHGNGRLQLKGLPGGRGRGRRKSWVNVPW